MSNLKKTLRSGNVQNRLDIYASLFHVPSFPAFTPPSTNTTAHNIIPTLQGPIPPNDKVNEEEIYEKLVLFKEGTGIEYAPCMPSIIAILHTAEPKINFNPLLEVVATRRHKTKHGKRGTPIPGELFYIANSYLEHKRLHEVFSYYHQTPATLDTMFTNLYPPKELIIFMDAFLYEGFKIVLKLAHAIQQLQNQGKPYRPLQDIWHKAVSNKLPKMQDSKQPPQNIPAYPAELYLAPSLKATSAIFKQDHWRQLWKWVPNRFKHRSMSFTYSSDKDGFWLPTLYSKCPTGPLLLVLRTRSQAICGAWCNEGFKAREEGKFFGSAESKTTSGLRFLVLIVFRLPVYLCSYPSQVLRSNW